MERTGNGYSSPGANVEDAEARQSHAPEWRWWEGERTATRKDNP
jgi:hypothetical protein